METSRTSLLEQKQLQWAKEREEISRLTKDLTPHKRNTHRSSICTYPNGTRISLIEMNGKQHPKYASTMSLQSVASNTSGTWTTSLANLQDHLEDESPSRRRSPSLPPIYKHEQRYRVDDQNGYRQSKLHQGSSFDTLEKLPQARYSKSTTGLPEDREGETSGYASDSLELPPHQQKHRQVPEMSCHVNYSVPDIPMGEKNWQNLYQNDENSLPSSRRFSNLRSGEFNRQRWGSVWGQETSKDLPPSWLERGLSRIGNNSQVLVINHDSASSPDSSTTGSLGSDPNKTYLRGQNLPIDVNILQEREVKRQKALEVQNAIKQQLEERERKRKEEKEKKLKEERAEEERIKRERDLEKQRFEEEQRRQLEKETAKLKKSKAMQEVIEAAERQAKEEKRQRRRRDASLGFPESKSIANDSSRSASIDKNAKETLNRQEFDATTETHIQSSSEGGEPVKLPVSQEVAIVLSGRIEDPELLSKSPLRLVNLIVSPSPGLNFEVDHHNGGIEAIFNGLSSPLVLQKTQISPIIVSTSDLVTPSRFRESNARDSSTQTDCEGETTLDFAEKNQEMKTKEVKDRKDITNNNRKGIEKSTNTGQGDESLIKSLGRSKSQARSSIESRPRWNANRPGTRYRTQSEKDPHYQRRMRMRRRQVETSDEGSSDFRRSPSPARRKYGITKAKSRSSVKRKAKLDNYDADLSMDSLNSLVPLHTDKNGRVNIENREKALIRGQSAVEDIWCGEEILSHLSSLRNGLTMKKKEWDLQECPISPITELY